MAAGGQPNKVGRVHQVTTPRQLLQHRRRLRAVSWLAELKSIQIHHRVDGKDGNVGRQHGRTEALAARPLLRQRPRVAQLARMFVACSRQILSAGRTELEPQPGDGQQFAPPGRGRRQVEIERTHRPRSSRLDRREQASAATRRLEGAARKRTAEANGPGPPDEATSDCASCRAVRGAPANRQATGSASD